MQEKIKNLLIDTLPIGFNIKIVNRKWALGGGFYLDIYISPNTYEISNVKGQHPQLVGLYLDLTTLELGVSYSGGNGGRSINVEPDDNTYYCKSIKVPFRKPQLNEESVMKAIKNFAINYIKLMKENKDKLMYKEFVDYSFLN